MAPFSIGVYQSSDGLHTDSLVGTINVTGDNGIAGDGLSHGTHTLFYTGGLNGLDGGQYYIAKLDCYNEVAAISRINLITSPLSGIFQDTDGSLYILASSGT